jgi:hypothetical protein
MQKACWQHLLEALDDVLSKSKRATLADLPEAVVRLRESLLGYIRADTCRKGFVPCAALSDQLHTVKAAAIAAVQAVQGLEPFVRSGHHHLGVVWTLASCAGVVGHACKPDVQTGQNRWWSQLFMQAPPPIGHGALLYRKLGLPAQHAVDSGFDAKGMLVGGYSVEATARVCPDVETFLGVVQGDMWSVEGSDDISVHGHEQQLDLEGGDVRRVLVGWRVGSSSSEHAMYAASVLCTAAA